MNRFILAGLAANSANLFSLATIVLFGGALACVIIDKSTLAGQLALGGLAGGLVTGGSFAMEVFHGKAAGNSSREQMYKHYGSSKKSL
jgi:hypothetical protein